MSLDLRRDCTFVGPAMPEPFVKFQLEDQLTKKKLLPKATGPEAKALQERWDVFRRKLGRLGDTGGEVRVRAHVLEPLVELLGWSHYDRAEDVVTREGAEDGGHLLQVPPPSGEGLAPHLRAWVVPADTDLDAPNKRGRAYRFSPSLVAQRVLLTRGERVALMTDGLELRILLSDPSGRDSHISIRLDRSSGWRGARDVPDSFRLLKALCQPAGVSIVGDLLNEARLAQSSVTKKLREQARRAVEQFLQGILDDPANADARKEWSDLNATSKLLWREGLVLIYRLLFILKLESSPDPARAFSFASTSLWRNSYSPSTALAPVVAEVRDKGAETGEFLASSLRSLFRLFSHGMRSSELNVSALGGVLFGKEAMPVLDSLHWSEQAVALLLDALLWTPPDRRRGQDSSGRERVHYGSLDVEDLGRVYEALLELEPGIASEPMCRLRRAKLEVVVPIAQAAPYRKNVAAEGEESDDDQDDEEEETAGKGKTKVAFIEEIASGRFYLRVGLGRKATGSYYTPHAFVRFLVQETLGPQIKERSPQEDPNPLAILALNVLDPAMGSGHFLVETCRYLGNALYEACRLCDERALKEREAADSAKNEDSKQRHLARARELWKRVEDLPDPNDELVAYLPSRVLDADEGGLSQRKAMALCRRLVAVHCLYGVDKNPLAVELAKVSLWLESYAEGLPLTFLDHRLVCGDSLTGPFVEHLFTFPGSGKPVETATDEGLNERLHGVLQQALQHVRDLESSVGKDIADLELKRAAKARLDEALAPFRLLAAAWSGGVMLGEQSDDDGYHALIKATAGGQDGEELVSSGVLLRRMIDLGHSGVPYDVLFPEVFHPAGLPARGGGFNAIVGNPPWDKVKIEVKQVLASFDLSLLESDRKSEWKGRAERLCAADPLARQLLADATAAVEHMRRIGIRLYDSTSFSIESLRASGDRDLFMMFVARGDNLLVNQGACGMVLSGGLVKNPAATQVRRHLLVNMLPLSLLHFHNRKSLFADLPSIIEFCLVSARAKRTSNTSSSFRVSLDLDQFGHTSADPNAIYIGTEDVESRFGPLLIPTKTSRTTSDALSIGAALSGLGLRVGTDVHRTADEADFSELGAIVPGATDGRAPETLVRVWRRGFGVVRDGRSIGQFDDLTPTRRSRWDTRAHQVIGLSTRSGAAACVAATQFRLVFRETCGSPKTNERSMVAGVLPPGNIATHKSFVEVSPSARPNRSALIAAAVLNCFPIDARLRPRVQTSISKALLHDILWPIVTPPVEHLLAHAALRLVCVHSGYFPLWAEQLGDIWRETQPAYSWPVLLGDDARWAVRAAIDAVVADAYGLDRDQYQHVLASFSHRSYPKAPELCLAAFDELDEIGLDAFCKKHDPYWDVPLVTTLPKPVIDLPTPQREVPAALQLTIQDAKPKRGRGRKGGG